MSTTPRATGTASESDVHGSMRHGAHPGPAEYIKIALTLAAITAIEVTIYYVSALQGVLVPLLLFLSIVKFSLVALFFMHLKFDSRLFSAMFVVGIMLAVMVFVVVLTMLRVFFA